MSGCAMSDLLSLREPRDRHDRPVPGVRHLAAQVVGGGHQAGEHRREPGPPLGRQWQVCQGAQLIDRLSGDEVLWIHGLLSSCGGLRLRLPRYSATTRSPPSRAVPRVSTSPSNFSMSCSMAAVPTIAGTILRLLARW